MTEPEPVRRRSLPAAAVAQLRPKQWVKNLVCLGAVVFSQNLFDADRVLLAGLGFAAFCLASSAVYVLNDLMDLKADRLNPRTARRPLAAGELPVPAAIGLLLACAAGAAGLSLHLGMACVWTVAVYAVMNIVYSLGLKREAIADVMIIGLGFVLRHLFGSFAVSVPPTSWSVLCIFFLALFFGFTKRRGELSAGEGRAVLSEYAAGSELLIGISASMTLICYAVFTVAGPQKNPTLVVSVLPVAYCVLRYATVSARAGHTPEDVVLRDGRLWLGVAAWAGICLAIIYGDWRLFVE